jgi:hypothetical protein
MPDLSKLLAKPERSYQPGTGVTAVLGRIANTPASPSAPLFVTIGAFDGHRVQWGPCPRIPYQSMPVRGQDCLVIFDENETPWVLTLGLMPFSPKDSPVGAQVHTHPANPT